MAFRVEPEKIDAYAELLKGLKDDVAKAQEYLNTHLSYGYDDARMFATIANANEDTKTVVKENLEHLDKLVTSSSDELEKASKMYQETDTAEERRLDSIYPSM